MIEIPTASFIEKFKSVNGALSVCESIAIFNLAKQVPEKRPDGFQAQFCELGTYKGKSAISAAIGLPDGNFTLVDPEFSDEKWRTEVYTLFKNIFDIKVRISCCEMFSIDFIPTIDKQEFPPVREYSYVFVDSGSHQGGLPMQEVKLLEDRMVKGGIIAFHDWNSQFVEVKEASDYLVGTGKYEYIPIDWEAIVKYVSENDLEKGNQSWHHTEMDFPCFVGAVRRK